MKKMIKILIVIVSVIFLVTAIVLVFKKVTGTSNPVSTEFSFSVNDVETPLFNSEKAAISAATELIGDGNTWSVNRNCLCSIVCKQSQKSSEFEAKSNNAYAFNINNLEENEYVVIEFKIWDSVIDKKFDKKPSETLYWSFIAVHGDTPIENNNSENIPVVTQLFINDILANTSNSIEEAAEHPLVLKVDTEAENIFTFSATNVTENTARIRIADDKSDTYLTSENNWTNLLYWSNYEKGDMIKITIITESGDFLPECNFEYIVIQIA